MSAVVGASHGDFERVRTLVEARPALARATWDWGFGDWESALGAASHTGQREIAAFLIGHGARPTIFSAAMLGQVDVVRAFVAASPGIQRVKGPHGITLLQHALAGADQAAEVVEYLTEAGGADEPPALEPLAGEDRDGLAGTYRFGPGPADACEVLVSRERLMIRFGGASRPLHHLGGLVFFPAGAEAVRISFVVANGSVSLRIQDGPITVSGTNGAGGRSPSVAQS